DFSEARGHGSDTRLCHRKTASPIACCSAPRAVLDSGAARDRGSPARFFGRSDITAPSDFPVHRQMVATDPGWLLRCQTDRDLFEQASSQPPVRPRQLCLSRTRHAAVGFLSKIHGAAETMLCDRPLL